MRTRMDAGSLLTRVPVECCINGSLLQAPHVVPVVRTPDVDGRFAEEREVRLERLLVLPCEERLVAIAA